MSMELNDPLSRATLTLRVRITKRYQLRLFIGLLLIKLATRILKCGYKLEEN